MTPELLASDRAPGLHVAAGVEIPEDTQIAPHVTIYAGVRLGAGVMLEQGAIVGRPQQIDARSSTPLLAPDAPTIIGDGCRIGSTTVVVEGAVIGRDTYIGDLVLLREASVVGEEAAVGRGCGIGHGVRIGARSRLQNECIVGPGTTIETDVLVGPSVTFVGDPTMGRRRDGELAGTVVRRAVRIGASAILIPPLEIGEEAVVGAATLVRHDVPPRTVVAGTPARRIRDVRDDELLERWRPAPGA